MVARLADKAAEVLHQVQAGALGVSIQWGRVPRNRRDAKVPEKRARKRARNAITFQ